MKIPFTGGCVYSAIRYECTAEPIMMLKCHCRDCQQISGGGFAAAVLIRPTWGLTRGQLRPISRPASDEASINAAFVPNAGRDEQERNWKETMHNSSGCSVAASLDDPSWFQPQMDIFVSEAQPWDQMDPAIPKFGQYPTITSEGVTTMQKITPFLWFDNQAEEAAKFYASSA